MGQPYPVTPSNVKNDSHGKFLCDVWITMFMKSKSKFLLEYN